MELWVIAATILLTGAGTFTFWCMKQPSISLKIPVYQTDSVKQDTDQFGNSILSCAPHATTDEVEKYLGRPTSKRADILLGCSQKLIDALAMKKHAIHYGGTRSDGTTVHVKINHANCPYVWDNKTRSAGVGIYVQFKGCTYTLLHKDKTRPILMAMGGSMTPNDQKIQDETQRMERVAQREVYEESCGTVRFQTDNGQFFSMQTDGIHVEDNLKKVAQVEFASTYFGISNIDDVYTRFATTLTDMNFIELLFDSRNAHGDCYKLEYVDHLETEYLLAVPLHLDNKSSIFPFLLEHVIRTKPQNASTLALLLDYAFFLQDSAFCIADIGPCTHLPASMNIIRFSTHLNNATSDHSQTEKEKQKMLPTTTISSDINSAPLSSHSEDRALMKEENRDDPLVLEFDKNNFMYALDLAEDHPNMKKEITRHFEAIDLQLDKIQRFCGKNYPRNFYDAINVELRQLFGHVLSIADSLKKVHPGAAYTWRTKVEQNLKHFKEQLEDKIEMPDTQRKLREQKTTELWHGQAQWHDRLLQTLAATHSAVARKRTVRCFFSYAWSSVNREKERWVQPFLERLREEMRSAGITALLDTQDCHPGDNPYTFMRENIDRSDYVFVFCTRSLLDKLHDGVSSHSIQTEIVMVQNRGRGIIPVILSGTQKSSVPIELYHFPIIDAHDSADYPLFVQRLIALVTKE